MIKQIFSRTLIVCVLGTGLSSCQSSTSNADEVKVNLQVATENLLIAKQEQKQTLKDSIYQFRITAKEKIRLNEIKIAAFKAGIVNENGKAKISNNKTLAGLELKNRNLLIRLDHYEALSIENWIAFRNEFNHDFDKLGEAFKGLTIKNVK